MADKLQLSPPPQTDEFGNQWRTWLHSFFKRVGDGPLMLKSYTVATVPTAAEWGDGSTFSSLIFVSDETGGATVAFNDGTKWRRVTDRAVVA